MKILTIAIGLLLALSACTGGITGKVTDEDIIKVAWIGPLSGPGASLGMDNLRGVELAISEINEEGGINGKKVELIVENDEFLPENTIKAYSKVTRIDGVDAILTPSYTGALTVTPLAEKEKQVVISSLDSSEEMAQAGEYLFGTGIYDEGIGYLIADFAKEELSTKELAIIYLKEEAFMLLVKDAIQEKTGREFVVEEGYTYDTMDFRTSLTKVKSSDAEALVVLGYDEAGMLLKQAKQLGIEIPIIGLDTFTSDFFLEQSAGSEEGVYFTSWDASSKEYEAFEKRYVEKFTVAPDQPLFATISYDSMKILAEAMSHGPTRGEGLKNSMHLVKEHDGVSGTFTVSSDGIVRSIEEQMFVFTDNGYVIVN